MARRKPISERLLSWWRGSSTRNTEQNKRIDECLDDPDGAIALLQEEQGRLAQELEETFLAYDAKVQRMAKQLLASGEVAASEQELDRLRIEQQELWRLVRRAQAAERSSRDLQREVREWSERTESIVGVGHPDHPQTRTEIVESELRVRGVEPTRGVRRASSSYEGSARDAMPMEAPVVFAVQATPQTATEETVAMEAGPLWEQGTDEGLLREMRSREREVARLLAQPMTVENAVELASFARELRELHTHLRNHDRREKISRVRWMMGIPQR